MATWRDTEVFADAAPNPTWRDTRVAAEIAGNVVWRDTRIAAEVVSGTTATWRDTRVAAELLTSLVPPVADGGPSQAVGCGELVTMDSSASHAVLGTLASRTWRLISRTTGSPAPQLSSTTATVVTFRAPVWDQAAVYNIGLTVTDSNGLTSVEDVIAVGVAAADLTLPTASGWRPTGLLAASSTGWR